MTALELPQIAESQLLGFVLVLARVGGIFVFAPAFASPLIPLKMRLIAAGAIAVGLTPLATAGKEIPLEPVPLAALLAKEIVVGLAFALSIGILATGVQAAASFVDTIIGFSFASIVDPMSNMQTGVLGQLYGLIVALVFLLTGGDHLMLQGLAGSYELLPLSAFPDVNRIAEQAVGGLAQVFVLGFQIAAPVVIALLVVDAGLALVSRAVPQMNVFFVGLPLKVLVGLFVVGVSLPLVSTHVQSELEGLVRDGLLALRPG